MRVQADDSGCLTWGNHPNCSALLMASIRALVGYDTSDLKPASALVVQALPQCPPDLPLLEAMA